MSVPLGSVQTINVSSCVAQESAKLVREAHSQEDGTLLLLIPIVLGDFCLQEHAVGLVLGLDEYSMLILRKKGFVSDRRKFSGRATDIAWGATSGEEISYIENLPCTEAGPSIKPVIISELVDLDPLGIAGRLHLQRHGAAGGRWRLFTPGRLRNE